MNGLKSGTHLDRRGYDGLVAFNTEAAGICQLPKSEDLGSRQGVANGDEAMWSLLVRPEFC